MFLKNRILYIVLGALLATLIFLPKGLFGWVFSGFCELGLIMIYQSDLPYPRGSS